MNNYLKLSKTFMLVGGIIELMLALIHFIWPYTIIQSGTFANLPLANKEFILLASLAIGLCIFLFGSLSIYFSFHIRYGGQSAWAICFSQAILWIFRLVLEIIYPVRIPLYFIEDPTAIVIILASIMVMVYIIPLILYKNHQQVSINLI